MCAKQAKITVQSPPTDFKMGANAKNPVIMLMKNLQK